MKRERSQDPLKYVTCQRCGCRNHASQNPVLTSSHCRQCDGPYPSDGFEVQVQSLSGAYRVRVLDPRKNVVYLQTGLTQKEARADAERLAQDIQRWVKAVGMAP